MNVEAVFVHFKFDGRAGDIMHKGRYMDSQWADRLHAVRRQSELERVFAAFGASRTHTVSLVSMQVADAAITEPVKSQGSKP